MSTTITETNSSQSIPTLKLTLSPNISFHQLKKEKLEKSLENQDKDIDELANKVRRIKQISRQIGTELDNHNTLITEITDEVKETNVKMERSTKDIQTFHQKDKTKCILM